MTKPLHETPHPDGGRDPDDKHTPPKPQAQVGKAGDITSSGDPSKPWPQGTAHPGVVHTEIVSTAPQGPTAGVAGGDGGVHQSTVTKTSDPRIVSDAEQKQMQEQAIADHLRNASPDFASVEKDPNPPAEPEGGTKYAPHAEAPAGEAAKPAGYRG